MQFELDSSSPRAKKARLQSRFVRKNTQVIIVALLAISIIGAVAMIIVYGQVAAATAIPAALLVMFEFWVKDDIESIPAKFTEGAKSIALHEVLSPEVLASLKDASTAKGIIQSLQKNRNLYFFGARFGVAPDVFTLIFGDQGQVNAVWAKAYELTLRHQLPDMNGGAILLGLLSQVPNYEEYLATLHVEWKDLEAGLQWQKHNHEVVESLKNKDKFGGIAQDWTAGYTPILNRIGQNISYAAKGRGGSFHREVDTHTAVEDQILQILSTSGRQNVALVGDVGVGKSSTVDRLAYRMLIDPNTPQSLKYTKIFLLSAPTILSSLQDRQQLEGAINSILNEAYRAKNIILFLDDAQQFLFDGTGSVNLSSVLAPVIEGGGIRVIMSMTPQDWQHLAATNPGLAGMLNRVIMKEATQEDTYQVVEDHIPMLEFKTKVTYTYQAIKEAHRLSSRYVRDLAHPAKALQVLESAASFADEQGFVTEQSVQASIESTSGVKVQQATTQEKSQLINLEDQIHQRMINQERAVKVVSDALRRARSGVGSPDKPIGTFLFMGPTGVGKTELAKSIAHVYFGGAENVIRVDMNQYVNKEDLGRLLAPPTELADGLIAQIMKQPFSVVLFDEVEKAHPDVKNAFLQMLDEGTMRDSTNKEVSFRDSIIVATSNAGSKEIREHVAAQRDIQELEKVLPDQLITSGQFAPELINRFDEIVLFRPLNQAELLQIVDILIAGVNKTLARQHVSVQLTPAAKQWLVEQGYDPQMGARPLRRMVQRTVENVVAKKLLDSSIQSGGSVTLDRPDLEQSAT